jgi:peptidoglycan LD-endopeptidase CwlK
MKRDLTGGAGAVERSGKVARFDERSEKNMATLHPKAERLARQFMDAVVPDMGGRGVVVKIISGTRTYEEQDALYAKGRSTPGPRVTNARGGFSNHNFGIAWDIGLFRGGRYLETSPLYRECGLIGKRLGLEWGGDWKSFPDEPHFQLRTGLTLAQMRIRMAAGVAIV